MLSAERKKSKAEPVRRRAGHRAVVAPLALLLMFASLCAVSVASPQSTAATNAASPMPQQQPARRGVIRLRVRPKVDNETRGLSRKRFFLIKGSPEDNQPLIDRINREPFLTRECYYRRLGASEALVAWLKEYDCESVYCREVEQAHAEGDGAVPEFRAALARGVREFGSRELALRWLPVNLSDDIRSGFYKQQQASLRALVGEAEAASRARLMSVMTDGNGSGYFTDVEPGVYTVSNLVPAEIKNSSLLWNCRVELKPDDVASEKTVLLSNQKDKNVKCVGVEKPLPPCDGTTR